MFEYCKEFKVDSSVKKCACIVMFLHYHYNNNNGLKITLISFNAIFKIGSYANGSNSGCRIKYAEKACQKQTFIHAEKAECLKHVRFVCFRASFWKI